MTGTKMDDRSMEVDMLLEAAAAYLSDARYSGDVTREKAIAGLIYTVKRIKEEREK